jgi:hypothetical protein
VRRAINKRSKTHVDLSTVLVNPGVSNDEAAAELRRLTLGGPFDGLADWMSCPSSSYAAPRMQPTRLERQEEELRGRPNVRITASALQRPAARPAIGRTVEADLGIKDLCALRNADLANDQASFVRNDSHVPVVTTTERADDIAEVRRILHGGEGIA